MSTLKHVLGAVLLITLAALATPLAQARPDSSFRISEIRIDHPGTDVDEYFELAGTPGESLAGLTYIVIGDSSGGSGCIEASIDLTGYLIQLFDKVLEPLGFTLGTPREAERRGSHVSLRHTQGYRISQAMIEEMNVIPDFREPDNIRLGLAPLYTTYEDVWTTVERLRLIMMDELYMKYSDERADVR